jgi:hypothetical protein
MLSITMTTHTQFSINSVISLPPTHQEIDLESKIRSGGIPRASTTARLACSHTGTAGP